MKNFHIQKFFSPEKPNSEPVFSLKDLPADQKRSREKAIAKLDAYIYDVSKFARGNADAGVLSFLKQSVTRDSTFENIQKQMANIRDLLAKKPYSSTDWDEIISTNLNRIEADGTANIETFATKMSKRVFLQRIIGATETARILQEKSEKNALSANSPDAKNLQEQYNVSVNTQKQRSRLEQFLVAIEHEKDGMFSSIFRGRKKQAGLDSEIRHTQSLLLAGKFEEARSYATEKFDKRWTGVKIANIINSEQGLAEALRALRNTDAAEKVLLETVKDDKNNQENQERRQNASEKQKQFYDFISAESVRAESEKYKNESTLMLQKAIDALPLGDPDRKEMMANEKKFIDGFAQALALKNLASQYIAKNGTSGLPPEMAILNDMRGLNGRMNFSDENARLFKELAILAISMVVTLGASGVFAGSAAAARATSVMSKIPMGNKILKANTAIRSTMGKNAISGAAYQATIFTLSDETLRMTGLGSDGDRKGFLNFMDNLAKNTAMFTAFVGMEKLLSSQIFANIPVLKMMSVNPSKPMMIRDTIKLSMGDITVLQALYMAENGKLETDWKAFAAVVAFRGLTQFPNLSRRFQALPQSEQKELLSRVNGKNSPKKSPKNATKKSENISKTQENQKPETVKNENNFDEFDLSQFDDMIVADGTVLENIAPKNLPAPNTIWTPKIAPEMKNFTNHAPNIASKKLEYTALQKIRDKIANGPEKINVKNYTGDDIVKFFQKPHVTNGERITITIKKGNSLETLEYAVEQSQGKMVYKNVSNNGANVTLKNGDKIQIALDGKGRVYVDKEKTLHIVNVETFTPKSLQLSMVGDMIARGKNFQKTPTKTAENSSKKSEKSSENSSKTQENQKPENSQKNTESSETVLSENEMKIGDEIWVMEQDAIHGSFEVRTKSGSEIKSFNTKQEAEEFIRQKAFETNKNLQSHTKNEQKSLLENKNAETTAPKDENSVAKNAKKADEMFNEFTFEELEALSPQASVDLNAGVKSAQAGDTKPLENFFQKHWKAIASSAVGMQAFREALSKSRKPAIPLVLIPENFSDNPKEALEQCLLACVKNSAESTIDYGRISVSGKALSEDYRTDISRRWMNGKSWKNLMKLWSETMNIAMQVDVEWAKMLDERLAKINENPTVQLVKDLQKCVNMVAEDSSVGQDGILGPNTTRAIENFIMLCKKQFEQKNTNANAEMKNAENTVSENANQTASDVMDAAASEPQIASASENTMPITEVETIANEENVAKVETLSPTSEVYSPFNANNTYAENK